MKRPGSAGEKFGREEMEMAVIARHLRCAYLVTPSPPFPLARSPFPPGLTLAAKVGYRWLMASICLRKPEVFS